MMREEVEALAQIGESRTIVYDVMGDHWVCDMLIYNINEIEITGKGFYAVKENPEYNERRVYRESDTTFSFLFQYITAIL